MFVMFFLHWVKHSSKYFSKTFTLLCALFRYLIISNYSWILYPYNTEHQISCCYISDNNLGLEHNVFLFLDLLWQESGTQRRKKKISVLSSHWQYPVSKWEIRWYHLHSNQTGWLPLTNKTSISYNLWILDTVDNLFSLSKPYFS